MMLLVERQEQLVEVLPQKLILKTLLSGSGYLIYEIFLRFLPAHRYASAVFATATCLSVRLLRAGIVPSRVKAGS